MSKIDIVFKIGGNKKWGEYECLRYSIRSICKNFKDLGQICIVGTKPAWFTGYHIPVEDKYKKNKDASIIEKLLIACNDKTLSSDIVQISDDQLIIHPINSSFLRPFTINSDLRRMQNKRGISNYGKRCLATLATLEREGLPKNFYEIHCPVILNKQKFIEIMAKYPYNKGIGMVSNTLYFNNLVDNGEQPVENVRAFIKRGLSMGQIITACRGKLFLGYQRRALNENLKNYLKQTFKEKSIYEI